MEYFYLLFLLPPELVNIIYNINLKDKAVSSITRFYKNRYQCKYNMKYLIRYTLFMGDDISDDYIKTLQFILKNFYNLPKIFSRYFFKNMLSLLSSKLMNIYNFISLEDIDNYYLTHRLTKCIKIWFKFCMKINCKISFYTINHLSPEMINYKDYARNIKNKNFNNMIYAPKILNIQPNSFIYTGEAYEYLNFKLYTIENFH
tara:strand:- start:19872 stop:20477 length:606 start_codon:yes stop_codon:yes gene_type:complete